MHGLRHLLLAPAPRLMLTLLLAVAAAWPVGVEAATARFTISAPSIKPATVTAGGTLQLSTRISAQRGATVTVQATAYDGQGQTVRQQQWQRQRFKARKSKSFSARWRLAADLPAGSYRVVVRVLDADGHELARSRPGSFQVRARGGGSAPAAATPTPATPVAPPPPAPPPAPVAGVAIRGSSAFVAGITAGLNLMREISPADYAIVTEHVTEIREGPQNYAWGGSRAIQISASSATHSRQYAGSIVLHEAVHVKNWFTNNHPVFGCDGEAKSLRAQADYLRRAGDDGMSAWVESLIGTWC